MVNSLQLALERTFLASERTFLASIRTNSIFAGLVMILLNMKFYLSCIWILIGCILMQIYTSYVFIQIDAMEKKKYSTTFDDDIYRFHPLFYSFLLIFILLIMLLICIKLKYNI